jgi:hypothetical protein
MHISIEKAESKFDRHINEASNNRILFSGKFGTGKSYFLKKYFENNTEQHNLFWITPVNYVVGANEDIFEWIKIDLAKELTTKYPLTPAKEPFSDNLIIQTFLYNKAGSLFGKLIKEIVNNKVKDATGVDFAEKFKKEFAEYKQFRNTAQNDGVNTEEIEMFIDASRETQGSIYEENLTTRILRAYISSLKANGKKQNILVIDDLDRLDPEHIFRLLNILSAHNDHFDGNKFGFDKVIIVCDLDNIKGLYSHRYGPAADFEGYIEKFFTYEPFYFSLKDAITDYCQTSIEFKDLHAAERNILTRLLVVFYECGYIKTRNLKKITDLSISNVLKNGIYKVDFSILRKTSLSLQEDYNIDFNHFHIFKVIYVLAMALGGLDVLEQALRAIMHSKQNESLTGDWINDILSSCVKPYHFISYILEDKDIEAFVAFVKMDNQLIAAEQQTAIKFWNATTNLYSSSESSPADLKRYANYFEKANWENVFRNLRNNIKTNFNQFPELLLTFITFIKREHYFASLK